MKRVLWQSFDYPSDILLPQMKLGVSHKTGKTWLLTSWRRGEVYWSSGALMGGKGFKNISPNVTSMYDFVIVSNKDEEYFYFSKRNQILVSEWLLSPMGQLKDLKGEDIARADNCDGYNTNGGCQTWKQPMCRRQGDRFDIRPGYLVAG
uniref:Bulb-type lectin domain-containing protein n=1 Tax=Quercus lobata TaxID=97700 RepID=A0A7N2LKL6_QUELO